MHFKIWPVLIFYSISGATSINSRVFPDGFKFGVATASYQIEGGWNEDGKSPSIWDTYLHEYPERVLDGSNGDVACDSYHKVEEDIKLVKTLGVNFYRFSISWPRILPQATPNVVNQKGVDYYMKIFKLLNESGIEPIVTMYHWDLPQSLQDYGGWLNPKNANYFGDYAEFLYKTFGHYVKRWITINEPENVCYSGYGNPNGSRMQMAPGYYLPAEGVYRCIYTVLKAHAKAYHIYQDKYKTSQNGRISIVVYSNWPYPLTNSEGDVYAQELFLQFMMGIFTHPVYKGDWPIEVKERVAARSKLEGYDHSRLPAFTKEEIDYINGTSDFFGLNHYTSKLVSYVYNITNIQKNASFVFDQGFNVSLKDSWKCSSTAKWICMEPLGFRKLIKWIHDNYNQPEIVIMENGWGDDGNLNDPDRIMYLQEYLSSVLDAIYKDGVNVTGYSYWSLMDNFEWMFGYIPKFGLVQVDFKSTNRTRTPKKSFEYYKRIIQSRCLTNHCISSNGKVIYATSLLFFLVAILHYF